MLFRFLGGLAVVLVLLGGLGVWQLAPAAVAAKRRWHTIASRDDPQLGGPRFPLYRALVPVEWQCYEAEADSIAVTTEPLCTFLIPAKTGDVRLTVHNFPCPQVSDRIAPEAQVARWQRQLEPCDPHTTEIEPAHGGGFVGLKLRAQGLFENTPCAFLAWTMQLANTPIQTLSAQERSYHPHYYRQLSASYTLKASGPPASIALHSAALEEFATSFALLYELPSP